MPGASAVLDAAAAQLREYFAGSGPTSTSRSTSSAPTSGRRLARARGDPVRRHGQLRRAGVTARPAHGGARLGAANGRNPLPIVPPVPSRRRLRRLADRLRRRSRRQAGAARPRDGSARPVRARGPGGFGRRRGEHGREGEAEQLAHPRLDPFLALDPDHLHSLARGPLPVTAGVALRPRQLAETLHAPEATPPRRTAGSSSWRRRQKRLEYSVSVDRERTARSDAGGPPIPAGEGWSAEHLVLAGLCKCTLTSLATTRAVPGWPATGEAAAHTRHEARGGRALRFVEVAVALDVVLDPPLAGDDLTCWRGRAGLLVGRR